MHKRAPILLALACLLGGRAYAEPTKSQATPTAAKTTKFEPRAQQVLHDMSVFLAQQKAFEVDVEGSTDVVMENKQKVQLNREGHVWVERPNKVRVDRKGDLADAQVYYDGKMFTVFARNANAYAQRAVPATIDATVSELYDKVDMDLGPGDLLSASPEKTLTEDAVAGKYIGPSFIDDVKTHHIAFQGAEVDWELWVEDGNRPLPRKYVITSKKMESAPQYSVRLSNWKLVGDIPDQTFSFQPPKDAQSIKFIDEIKAAKTPKAKKE